MGGILLKCCRDIKACSINTWAGFVSCIRIKACNTVYEKGMEVFAWRAVQMIKMT